jgi:DNA-binding NtrC family response regulator
MDGTANEEVAVECMKGGAADYLLKDRVARLSSAVEHALEEQRLRQESRRMREQFARQGTALKESEARFASIINSATDGIITVNQTLDASCAEAIAEIFSEVIVAPDT